jgi:hypothetical protein
MRSLLLGALTGFLLCCVFNALGQEYRSNPCTPGKCGNAALYNLEPGTIIKGWINEGYGGNFCEWATSFLPPAGKAPEEPAGNADEELWKRFRIEYDEWSCMYAPSAAFDDDLNTGWFEGAEGNGIGEVLLVRLDTSRDARIHGGFARNQTLYNWNSRPRKINVYVLQADNSLTFEYGTAHFDLKVLAKGTYELSDVKDYQILPIPSHRAKAAGATFVAIEILSVYEGSRWGDTGITEVGNTP